MFNQLLSKAAGYHFNPAHASGNTTFADHTEAADLSGAVNVGTTTEFHADALCFAEADDAYFIAILFAKERHRPFLHRPFVGSPAGVNRIIRQHNRIRLLLNLLQLGPAQRLGMGKVKAQPLWRHRGAGLVDMAAQPFTQHGVQHMGAGMVAHDIPAPVGIDRGVGWITDLHRATDHLADMDNQALDRAAHPRDFHRPDRHDHIIGEVIDFARVADLATTFHIERRFGQHKLDGRANVRDGHHLAVNQQSRYDGVNFGDTLIDQMFDAALLEFAFSFERIEQGGINAHIRGQMLLCGLTAARFRFLQGSVKARFVHRKTLVTRDIAREIDRETVGVPETESIRTGDFGFAFGAQIIHQIFEQCQTNG